MRFISLSIASFALIAFPFYASAEPPKYNLTPLGSPAGFIHSSPTAINNSGQVVGFAWNSSGNNHAFLWSNGSMRDLGTLGGTDSWASGINNSGQVVGRALNSDGRTRAFLWQNDSMQDLGTLYNNPSSQAQGINDSGQIVGWNGGSLLGNSAFLWENGSMRDIGNLNNEDAYARAINNSGQIVGDSTYAFLWQNNVMNYVGPTNVSWSSAVGINNSGQILLDGGYNLANGGQEQSFIWDNGSMNVIPLWPQYNFNTPHSINDLGQVVGTAYSYELGYTYRAFLYQNGITYNLNNYLAPAFAGKWFFHDAFGINNLGQIVAYGIGPDMVYQSVLLTPVPEPAAFSFMMLGLALIAGYQKK